MARTECAWMVGVGAALFFLNCCALGANSVFLAWGPLVGAKSVKYQVAAPVCALCAFIGALLFGERSAPLFGGYLYDLSGLQVLPDLTLYSMIWPPLVLLAWQALALWWQVPVVHYLGFASAMVGTALVYPGWKYINWGYHPRSSASAWSRVPGVGAVFIPIITVPLLTVVMASLFFLTLRGLLIRGDDPFHKVLWCLPGISCLTTVINVSYILYTISFPTAWAFNNLSPQGVTITLCACGIGALCVMLVRLPGEVRRAKLRAPALNPVKHMNLLGLDADVLLSLNAKEPPTGLKGWTQLLLTRLFVHDINSVISRDEMLMHIHSSAEDFDSLAEPCFIQLQFITCCLMSMGYAARTVGVAGNCFATMLQIYNTKQVQGDAEIGWTLRLFGAAGIAVGILLGGWRLVPVSGAQLAKMTPLRSYAVTTASSLTASVVFGMRLGGGMTPYVNISAVWAVGLAEGVSHVNWRKVLTIVGWGVGSLIPILLAAAALLAQGMYPPSSFAVEELVQTEAAMQQAMTAIAAIGNTTSVSDDLLVALQQAIAIYEQSLAVCPSPAITVG